jgi:hypothetical protein
VGTAAGRRVPLELLAMGACWSLAAVVCYLPFLLSPPAGQNDRFLTNAVLGLGLFLVGDTLLIVATDWVVPRRWHSAALVATSALLVLALTSSGGMPGGLAGVAVVIAGYTAISLVLSVVAARWPPSSSRTRGLAGARTTHSPIWTASAGSSRWSSGRWSTSSAGSGVTWTSAAPRRPMPLAPTVSRGV